MYTDTDRTRGAESDLNRMIKELEKLIGTDWKRLAREFNFTPTDIDAIEFKDPRNLYEHIHQCFSKWKMQEGNNATVKKLRDALTKAGLQHILMDLDRALAGVQYSRNSVYTKCIICSEAYGIPKKYLRPGKETLFSFFSSLFTCNQFL